MGVADIFNAVLARLEKSGDPAEPLPHRLAKACTEVLPIDGAGISFFTSAGLRVPIGASDDDATTVEQLEFTVGQGPGYRARETTQVVRADLSFIATSWPVFHDQLVARTPIRSITAYPMSSPLSTLGTIDLFSRRESAFDPIDVTDVDIIVALISMTLLDSLELPGPSQPVGAPPAWIAEPLRQRTDVMVALGMVNAELDLDNSEAMAVLRGHAYVVDLSLEDASRELVNRQLPVSDLGPQSNC